MSSLGNKIATALITTKCNLKSCKSIKVAFNPWFQHSKSIRAFNHLLQSTRMRDSNDKCRLSVDIRSDNSEPTLEVNFIDDTVAVFKTKNLTMYDIATEFESLSRSKAPKEVKSEY